MNYKITTLPSFHLIGLPLRTTNENNQSMKDIGANWQRFYSENVISKIPNKVDDDGAGGSTSVLGLYTDYEGDYTKPYTLIIGCKVSSSHAITQSHGMTKILVSRTIPETKYAVFTAKGKMPDCIM